MRTLKQALEGEQIDFVHGISYSASLEAHQTMVSLEDDLDELDTQAREAEIADLLDGKTVSETALEDMKDILKKVGQMLAKIIAAILSLVAGFKNWLLGGHKRRKLTKEIYKAYLDMSVIFSKLGKINGADIIDNTMKVDKLAEAAQAKASITVRAIVGSEKYLEAIKKIIAEVCESKFSHALRENASGLGAAYKRLAARAQDLDKNSVGEGGNGAGLVLSNKAELDKFTEQVDHELGISGGFLDAAVSAVKENYAAAAEIRNNAANAKWPQTFNEVNKVLATDTRDIGFEMALRHETDYAKMFEDVEKSLAGAEERFSKLGESQGADSAMGKLPATTYLQRAYLEALREFGKAIQMVSQAYALIDDAFAGVVQSRLSLLNQVLDAAERAVKDWSGNPSIKTGMTTMIMDIETMIAKAEISQTFRKAGFKV